MIEESIKDKNLIIELLRKLDEERQKNSRLQSELSQYKDPDKNRTSLEAQLQEKDHIIKEQKKVIDKLNLNLAWLKRKMWGRSSEQYQSTEDPAQLTFNFGELHLTPEEEAAYKLAREEADAYHKRRLEASKKRKSNNKPSRNPLPENLRREIVEVFPEGYNPEEWEILPQQFDEIKEVLERKPAEYYVTRYILHKAIRKNDMERSIQGSVVPVQPIAKSYAGASTLAHLIMSKYSDCAPFYRQVVMMKRLGVSIPPTTINDWFLDVADLLRPFYFRIRDLVLGCDYIQADETTVPVINNEKHKTVKGYLWQVRDVMNNLLFFHYDKGSRSKDVALALFAHFSGALQTDGYAVYDMYEGKEGILTLICWAHARRYFERSLSNDEKRAKFALELIALLYEIEREADEKQLSYDERRDLRLRLSVPILKNFEAWLDNEYAKVMPKSPIGKAIHFAASRYDRLCRYVIDGRYRIDSNLVENGQRSVACGRKNYLFCGNHDAAEDAAVMYTVMGCCKVAGVNEYDWLVYFLNHIHEYDNDYSKDLIDFLPARLKAKGLVKDIEVSTNPSEKLAG